MPTEQTIEDLRAELAETKARLAETELVQVNFDIPKVWQEYVKRRALVHKTTQRGMFKTIVKEWILSEQSSETGEQPTETQTTPNIPPPKPPRKMTDDERQWLDARVSLWMDGKLRGDELAMFDELNALIERKDPKAKPNTP